MKKVIFLCVLSLSLCLSKAAEEKAPQALAALNATDAKLVSTVNATPPHEKSQEAPVTNKNETTSDKPAPPPSLPSHIITTKPEVDNKTADKPTPKEETAKPSNNETKVIPDKESKAVKPDEKPKNETSTEKVTEKPTETPKVTEAPKSMHIIEKARGFDGPSFIGGIILTLGLLAIGFMGLKYYKNQTERNYHTL